jgi:hypothetical protein
MRSPHQAESSTAVGASLVPEPTGRHDVDTGPLAMIASARLAHDVHGDVFVEPQPRLTPPTPPPYTDERVGLWRSWERA